MKKPRRPLSATLVSVAGARRLRARSDALSLSSDSPTPSITTLPSALPPSFRLLARPVGVTCGLDCASSPGTGTRMTDETLEQYIRQLLEAHRAPTVTISWQGGEPTLMGLEFFRRAVELGRRYARPDQTVVHAIQTSGSQVDAAWARFFAKNGFLVGISIDGPRELHDAYRRNKAGEPAFDVVMRGLDALREAEVDWNSLTTVNAANEDHAAEVYGFLRDECDCRFMQLIPVVERPCKNGVPFGYDVTQRSVSPEGWGQFLIDVFEEWVRHDVGQVFVQHFDAALANWFGEPSGFCVHSASCGTVLAMEASGDVYACEHFIEPDYLRGSIHERHLAELVSVEPQRWFGNGKQTALPQYCLECDVRFACHGGCVKDRIRHAPDGQPGLNYLCRGYKTFFHHIDEPMRRMCALLRERRPPAEIVAEYEARDQV
ncbi:MAG: anaerobic sulfatase maturase [Actinobacteria bacterium]|nr:anaerobic sulfatase maturase [Actinomycetota bacterium]